MAQIKNRTNMNRENELAKIEFEGQNFRTFIDEKGKAWFAGIDVANYLGYKKPGNAVRTHTKKKGALIKGTLTSQGVQSIKYIDEPNLYRLIANSKLPKAEKFERWIFEEVLPEIRRTGKYKATKEVKENTLFLLNSPKSWNKVFPDELKTEVMRVYGFEWDCKKNTPQWVGNFINTYVYSALNKELASKLKKLRKKSKSKLDEWGFLHQFMSSEGTDTLREQIKTVIVILKLSLSREEFIMNYKRVHENKNQYKLTFSFN